MVAGSMSSAVPPSPRKGRPLDRRKGAAILHAAQRLFLTSGFVGTSMDAVADAAGVSKLTVYRHFGSKQDLFARAVATKCEEVLGTLGVEQFAAMDVKAGLTGFGRAFLTLILDPDAMAVHRLVAAERDRAPELGSLFYANAVEPTTLKLAALLACHVEAGRLPRELNPITAAQDLLALWRARPFLLRELGLPDPDVAAHVTHGIEFFLRAWARP